jgi:gliding motility-associated-like protein
VIDTTGINYIHLRGDSTYTLKATNLITGCYSVADKEVPLDVVYPLGVVSTTPSYCSDAIPNDPLFRGNGSVTLSLTNTENVVLREVTWYDDMSSVVGFGTQVFELPPGFYNTYFISNEYCPGTARGEIKTEIRAFNLVSVNSDNSNDSWVIDCISNFTTKMGAPRDNNVKIFNRYGVLVYEIDGYDNADKVFTGIGENGVYSMGNQLPDGTYFYIIDKRDGSKPLTGFLELVR